MAGTLSLISESAPSNWVLGGVKRARKLKNAVQIITMRFNDPLQSEGQNQKWTTIGPSGYMHAFFVFSKIGKKFGGNLCTKKIVNTCLFFFAVNACTKKSSNRVIFFCGKRVYKKNRQAV